MKKEEGKKYREWHFEERERVASLDTVSSEEKEVKRDQTAQHKKQPRRGGG